MPANPMAAVAAFFDFDGHRTTFQREAMAGLTTFFTMSYIIAVNPAILKEAGIPPGPSMVATILAAVAGTLIMGLYANRPFAIAPYMGENAFIAFTVVKSMGFSWQTAMAAVFLSGIMFVVLTVARIRQWLLESVPEGLRYSFAAGIGLFLVFIGMNEAGIVVPGVPGAPVRVGVLTSPIVLIAVAGFLLISVLMIRKVPGAILVGILTAAAASFVLGLAPAPARWIGAPPDLRPLLFQLDLRHAFSWTFMGVLLVVFMMAFIDTLGSLIGLSARAGFLDADGRLPQIERPMLADAIATTMAGLIGTTTSGTFIESATGITAGGRTGFTAVVTALLFAAALFFAPLITAIPAMAYSPALIAVGLQMMAPIARIDLEDYTEMIPAFAVIVLISFTYNIGIGITGGFVLYTFFKLVTGRAREVRPGLWVLSALSLLFFIFYPYR
jgi:AGZA family xanthine/uracil permease-like MFS transporter